MGFLDGRLPHGSTEIIILSSGESDSDETENISPLPKCARCEEEILAWVSVKLECENEDE